MNNSDFIEEQLYLTTAEEETQYFFGIQWPTSINVGEMSMATGLYRVVDGVLCPVAYDINLKRRKHD